MMDLSLFHLAPSVGITASTCRRMFLSHCQDPLTCACLSEIYFGERARPVNILDLEAEIDGCKPGHRSLENYSGL